jgi:hypothetical protein
MEYLKIQIPYIYDTLSEINNREERLYFIDTYEVSIPYFEMHELEKAFTCGTYNWVVFKERLYSNFKVTQSEASVAEYICGISKGISGPFKGFWRFAFDLLPSSQILLKNERVLNKELDDNTLIPEIDKSTYRIKKDNKDVAIMELKKISSTYIFIGDELYRKSNEPCYESYHGLQREGRIVNVLRIITKPSVNSMEENHFSSLQKDKAIQYLSEKSGRDVNRQALFEPGSINVLIPDIVTLGK